MKKKETMWTTSEDGNSTQRFKEEDIRKKWNETFELVIEILKENFRELKKKIEKNFPRFGLKKYQYLSNRKLIIYAPMCASVRLGQPVEKKLTMKALFGIWTGFFVLPSVSLTVSDLAQINSKSVFGKSGYSTVRFYNQ